MIKPAMEDAAEKVCATMRSLVPVEQGNLRNSIGWTWGDAPTGSLSAGVDGSGMTLTIYAGNEVAYYARFVEFGTAAGRIGNTATNSKGRKRKVRRNHSGTKAQPFFFPSYRLHKKQMVAAMRKAIRSAVKQVVA